MQKVEQVGLLMEHMETQSSATAEEIVTNDFVKYASRLWQARWFIVAAVLASAIASAILSLVLPKKYESTARLMPPGNRSSQASALLADAAGSPADAGASMLGIQSPSAIYEQVLGSRAVQDRLIDKFDLRRVYGVKTRDDTRLLLAADTEIADDRKSGVVTIIVKSKTPQLAAGLAKGYCDELNELMVELDTSAAHRERVFLESRLKGIAQDLENYSQELSQFTSKNTVVVGEEQSKAIFTAAETLRGQAIVAKADLLALQQKYNPNNERVKAAQAKLNELERQLDLMRGGGSGNNSTNGFPSIRELPLLGARYSSLYRGMTVEEAVYVTLTKQLEMAKVEEARDLPTVRVLDVANVPEKKSWPKRTLLVITGAFLGFLFSCACVLGRDWWRGSRSPWRQVAGEITEGLADDLSHIPGFRKRRTTSR